MLNRRLGELEVKFSLASGQLLHVLFQALFFKTRSPASSCCIQKITHLTPGQIAMGKVWGQTSINPQDFSIPDHEELKMDHVFFFFRMFVIICDL